MGTSNRPSIIEKDINRLFDLIRKDVKKARKLLEKLKSKVEGESPELVRADALKTPSFKNIYLHTYSRGLCRRGCHFTSGTG